MDIFFISLLSHWSLDLLGTHDVQDVTVMPTPGGVTVTGYFVDKSSAVGVLLIMFSLTNEDDISYVFVPRPRESQDIERTLTGLSEGDYQVSFFVMDEDGLPFNRSANLPRNISVSEGTYIELTCCLN